MWLSEDDVGQLRRTALGDLRGNVLPGLDATGRNPGARYETPNCGTAKFGHGTDMAILIAGTGRGAGLKGVAPRAKILPVSVSTGTHFQADLVANGITLAVDHGAKIINLSLGAVSECDAAERASIVYAYRHDVIVVASAGDAPGPVATPANCPGALAMGGVDSAFQPWTQTPAGPEIDFVAPAFNRRHPRLRRDPALLRPHRGSTARREEPDLRPFRRGDSGGRVVVGIPAAGHGHLHSNDDDAAGNRLQEGRRRQQLETRPDHRRCCRRRPGRHRHRARRNAPLAPARVAVSRLTGEC